MNLVGSKVSINAPEEKLNNEKKKFSLDFSNKDISFVSKMPLPRRYIPIGEKQRTDTEYGIVEPFEYSKGNDGENKEYIDLMNILDEAINEDETPAISM